jgi:hypothetical protein
MPHSYQINDLFDQEKLPLLNRATRAVSPGIGIQDYPRFLQPCRAGICSETEYNCETSPDCKGWAA